VAIYDSIGNGYSDLRRPDPRIGKLIDEALGDAASVVNVGAGAGSYEPAGREVLGVEPSSLMREQRSLSAAPCIAGRAEALPLPSNSYDAAMAILTIHHWSDLAAGLREMTRVARRRIVLLTWDPDGPPFWLTRDYFPELLAVDRRAFPRMDQLLRLLGKSVSVAPVGVPHDCVDGFLAAYWRRPQAYHLPAVRNAISSFSKIDPVRGLERLKADLSTGAWAARNTELLSIDEADLGYRLVSWDF
jgi:SAM-dependent methyltransferase